MSDSKEKTFVVETTMHGPRSVTADDWESAEGWLILKKDGLTVAVFREWSFVTVMEG